jgi:hypothetical protein
MIEQDRRTAADTRAPPISSFTVMHSVYLFLAVIGPIIVSYWQAFDDRAGAATRASLFLASRHERLRLLSSLIYF